MYNTVHIISFLVIRAKVVYFCLFVSAYILSAKYDNLVGWWSDAALAGVSGFAVVALPLSASALALS
jgi:hypothetical protein